MRTYEPKSQLRERSSAQAILPFHTPVEPTQDALGAAFVGVAVRESASPLHALVASQLAFDGVGSFPALSGSNAGLTADLGAFASAPAVARASLAARAGYPGARRGPAPGRYDLPDAAKDGEGMLRQLGRGQALDPSARLPLEAILGQDLSAVRIHAGGKADALADSIDARAFTIGEDVVFADGEYQPDTHAGRALLAHELTHVLQFRRGDPNTRSADPRSVKAVEDEADRNAQRASMLLGAPSFAQAFAPEAVEARGRGEEGGHDVADAVASAGGGSAAAAVAPGSYAAPDAAATVDAAFAEAFGRDAGSTGPGGGAALDAVAARDGETTELMLLIHRYRRLVRRIKDANDTLTEFRGTADAGSQQQQAGQVTTLGAQLQTDTAARDQILARITTLKGQAYTDSIVAKYAGEQDEGGWRVERSAETSRETGGGRTTEGTRSTRPAGTETGAGTGTGTGGTETGTGTGTEGTETGTGTGTEGTETGAGTGTGTGGTGTGGNQSERVSDGQVVQVGNGRGLPTGSPPPPPNGDPGAHLDQQAPPPARTAPPATTDEAEEAEERHGPPTGRTVESGNEPVRYELVQGDYADVHLDVAYLDFQGTLQGDTGQLPDLPEIAMELRNAKGIGDVVHILSQIDPSKFAMTGEIRAALDLIRATMTVEGAPLPFNLGGQEFLVDWMLQLTARAYAELYATGEVTPDLGNLSLNVAGAAGGAALIEAGATLVTAADWLGDAYAPLLSVSAEAAGSAGAAASIEGQLNISPEAIEIGYKASVTWGLGGSLKGKLRVCVLPVLELIATYMGIDVQNLPEPLSQVYEAFKNGKDLVANILAAWEWLRDRKPLQMAADLLLSEQFWSIFDQIVEMGVDAIDVVGWIKDNYVQLGETPPQGTVCGIAFESEFLWYLFAFGLEFLGWVQERGKDVVLAILPFMREASRAVLTFIIRAGPWIIDVIRTSWSALKAAAEFLGEQFAPVLETLEVVWDELGAPALDWVLEQLGKGYAWVAGIVGQYGPPIVAWLQGLPAEVQAFFERFTPQVIDALYRGGQYLVEALGQFGADVLAYIEQWAPGVVALFSQMGADAWNVIKGYGIEFLHFCVQVGQNALQLIGPYAAQLWEYIRGEAVPAVMDFLVLVCRDYIQPALRLLDESASGLLRAVVDWLRAEGPGFGAWLAQNLSAVLDGLGRVGAELLPYLSSLRSGVQEVLQWLVTASVPVLHWLAEAADWFVEQLQAMGPPLLQLLTDIGEFLQPLWQLGREQFLAALELIKDGARWLAAVIAQYGPPALAYLTQLGREAIALFSEATKQAIGYLIDAGAWTLDLIRQIGEPLIPVLMEWGAQLKELGATVCADLIAAWRQYGAPVFTFLLRVGKAGWDALGQGLSAALPVIARFVRDGVANAVEFITVLCRDHVGPALTLVLEASADALARIYEFATTDGVALAQRIGANAAALAQAVAEAGVKAWNAFLEFGDWVLSLGSMAAGPFYEVLEKWGPQYRDLFVRYGVPLVRFLAEVGDAAAELLGRLGEAVARFVVDAGEAIYEFARDQLLAAIEKVVAFGQWIWPHLVEFGQRLLDVIAAVGEAAVRAWEQYGRPVVRFFVELAQDAVALLAELGEDLYKLLVSIGDAIWQWARATIPPVLRKLKELGEAVWDAIVAIGTPIVRYLAEVAETVWAGVKEAWIRYGRPVAEFCIEVGGQILDFLQWCGQELWEQVAAQGRKLLALWREHGAPILQAIGSAVIKFGSWVWRQVYDNGKAVLDVLIHASVELGRALQRVGMAVWTAAKALGAAVQELWAAYGQPLVDALVQVGQRVVAVYQRYGAPIVRKCLDFVGRVGNAIWEGAVTIGERLWQMLSAVGETIFDWMRRTAVAAWRTMVEAGQRVWGLAQRLGAEIYRLAERFGAQLIEFGRRAIEAQVTLIANAGAWLLERVLATGFVLLDAIGRVGVALVDLLRDVPRLAGLIRDKGVAFAQKAVEYGAAFVNLIADSPAIIYEICMRRGRAAVNLFLRFGQRLVALVVRLGETVIDIVTACGEWVLSFLERLGQRVVDLWIRGGAAALSALQAAGEWGDWVSSWFD